MPLHRELFLSITTLVLLNLCLAFGAIGLFLRMGPAIERILEENVYSIVAAEEILSEFAYAGGSPLEGDARARVREALDNAQRNVTEEGERPVLQTIERSLSSAVTDDHAARRVVVSALRDLIEINRGAMHGVDEEARRLGSAGAWASVFIGFLSFLLSIIVLVRLQRRVVQPLVDLHQVLEGDPLRRCRAADAPHEVLQVARAVNRLLDERLTTKRELRRS